MKKIITSVFVIVILTCMLFTSCLYGIRGNRKVVKSERQVSSFEAVSASAGIEVILLQDSVTKVVVEADSNLQEIIKTEVSKGELKIYPKKRISTCESKKVFVTFKNLHSIEASSGSEVKSTAELRFESLQVSGSSGADIELKITANKLNLEGSSGANITIKGNVQTLDVDGSSGANIKAKELSSKSCNAGASSGANLRLVVTDKINAQASSGGNIKISGNPKERNVEKSSGGNVDID